jgi:hypothetical protein
MSHELKWKPPVLHVRLFGAVTHDDLVACCVDAAADWPIADVRYILLDFGNVGAYACTRTDLAMLASGCAQLIYESCCDPHLFIAAAATDRHVLRVLDRCNALGACEVEVFTSAADAERHVGTPYLGRQLDRTRALRRPPPAAVA